jgi:hypothetical protein
MQEILRIPVSEQDPNRRLPEYETGVLRPRDHTYSAVARIPEFTERKPWSTAPPVHTIRFVCGDNTDEWLARLCGLSLLPVVYRTRVSPIL